MNSNEQKIVTALGRLLLDTDFEKLTNLLTKLGLRYTIKGNCKSDKKGLYGHHKCTIFIQEKQEDGTIITIREYEGSDAKSAKGALIRAISKFFIFEEHDYHSYRALISDESKSENFI